MIQRATLRPATPPRAISAFGLLGALLLAVPGCGYSPSFDSGRLRCGPSESCPEGYYCAEEDQRCWRNGEEPTDPEDRFVGVWDFVRPSTRSIVCTDGSSSLNEDWAGRDFVEIDSGSGGTLVADFFCLWVLGVSATGNATVIQPGQSCSDTDPADPNISYTWRGEAFTITSTDGRTATGQLSLPYDYQTPAGNGSCTMTYTVTLTKDQP